MLRCSATRAMTRTLHEPWPKPKPPPSAGDPPSQSAAPPPENRRVNQPETVSPIRLPCSPEWWRGDEALQAEAQAPQAPREQGHQAAGNVSALRPRGLFSAGVRFATASHMPVDTAQ